MEITHLQRSGGVEGPSQQCIFSMQKWTIKKKNKWKNWNLDNNKEHKKKNKKKNNTYN